MISSRRDSITKPHAVVVYYETPETPTGRPVKMKEASFSDGYCKNIKTSQCVWFPREFTAMLWASSKHQVEV